MLMRTTILPTPTSRPAIQRRSGRDQDISSLVASMELMGAAMNYGRDAEIFGEGEAAEYLYLVMRGAVRSYKLLEDGRRQVTGFHLPGEIFGLEIGESHRLSAEAITNSTIIVVKRSALWSLADRQGNIARELWLMAAREVERVQQHMLVLGCMRAKERVGSFLLAMAGRASSNNEFELPMSRQDIADYLGLTIETVSRTMTQLEADAAIGLPTSRRIVLRNRAALNQLDA
jgi:CRP-like cAMP-binding protein